MYTTVRSVSATGMSIDDQRVNYVCRTKKVKNKVRYMFLETFSTSVFMTIYKYFCIYDNL